MCGTPLSQQEATKARLDDATPRTTPDLKPNHTLPLQDVGLILIDIYDPQY